MQKIAATLLFLTAVCRAGVMRPNVDENVIYADFCDRIIYGCFVFPFKPVCGLYNGEYVNFPNLCLLCQDANRQACRGEEETVTFAYEGHCDYPQNFEDYPGLGYGEPGSTQNSIYNHLPMWCAR
ncbi:uncharacterized protein [Ptychodera flava]|uniref:uncharacterized protein n=1 Tax=Ptychodera flava TaxID=63121 RepID=UPI003969C61F